MPNFEQAPAQNLPENEEQKKTAAEEITDNIDEEIKRLDAEEGGEGIGAMIGEEVEGLERVGDKPLNSTAELGKEVEALKAEFENVSKKSAESFVGLVESLDANVNPEDFVRGITEDIAAAFPQTAEGKARELMQAKASKAFKKAAKEILEGKIISLTNSEEISSEEAKMITTLEKALDSLGA